MRKLSINDFDTTQKERIHFREYFEESERGMALLLKQLKRGELIYNWTQNQWMIYTAGRWCFDNTGQARKECHDLLTSIIKHEIDDLKLNWQDTKEEKQYFAVLKKVKDALNSRNKINAVMDLAAGELPSEEIDFDYSPMLFMCFNGVWDFQDMKFLPHSPEFMISKRGSVVYDPNAECPKWLEFLDRIFLGDADLIEFMQKAIAYSMTGLKDFQGFFFCYGDGANGKSTLFNVLQLILNDYYLTIPVETILNQNIPTAKNDYILAQLKGVRMVITSEIPQGKKLNESLIKDLTGGDDITARKIYGSPFTFKATHKLWMFGNHKPIIAGSDHGIWRRVFLIPFLYKFSESEKRDMDVVMGEFKAELSGILNWIIQGFKLVNDFGLKPPKIVNKQVEEYKKESDPVALWMELRLTTNVGQHTDFSTIYNDYINFCDETGEFQVSKKAFSKTLKTSGIDIIAGIGNKRMVKDTCIKGSESELNKTNEELPF
jgi:putative DNA primase/helicase